jgi:hypothetical protein
MDAHGKDKFIRLVGDRFSDKIRSFNNTYISWERMRFFESFVSLRHLIAMYSMVENSPVRGKGDLISLFIPKKESL